MVIGLEITANGILMGFYIRPGGGGPTLTWGGHGHLKLRPR